MIVDVQTVISHSARPEDMRGLGGPSTALCGGEFFWVSDDVSLPEPTIYFKGVAGLPKYFPVTCIGCLAWQSS